MKFLLLFPAYEECLHQLYRRQPALATLAADEQHRKIWEFGFGSGYNFAPYMGEHGFESKFYVSNCQTAQLEWARERGIPLSQPQHWIYEVAAHQINTYKPDVLFIGDLVTYDSKFIRILTHKPKVVLGWRASAIVPGTDWSEFDAILTNLTAIRQVAIALGAKRAYHFWPGFEKRIADAVWDQPIDFDLVFCGLWSDGHADRNRLILRLATEAEQGTLGFTIGLFVSGRGIPPIVARHNQGASFGLDYYRALRSGRVALDARGSAVHVTDPITGKQIDLFRGETGTNRMLEVTGVGRLLLAEHYDNLGKYFDFGSEIDTFDSFESIRRRTIEYRENEEKCFAIASRGHERCMLEHSMHRRSKELANIIAEILRDESKGDPSLQVLEAVLADGWRYFDNQQIEEVLESLSRYVGESLLPRDFSLLYSYALAAKGRLQESMVEAERELMVYPDNQSARIFIAELSKAVGSQPSL